MSAVLLTTLMSPSMALLRGTALPAAPRAPLLAAVLRSRGGATMAAANAQTAPTAVPLTAATLSASSAELASWKGDLLLLPCWEAAEKDAKFELPPELSALDASLDGFLSSLAADDEFKGKAGSSVSALLPKGSPARKAALVGLGKQEGFTPASAAKWGAALAAAAKEHKAKTAAALVPSLKGKPLVSSLQTAALTAALLGLSPDVRYKSKADPEASKMPPLTAMEMIGGGDAEAVAKATSLARGILLTRGLVGSPANYLTPTAMAEAATTIAGMSQDGAMTIQVLEKSDCEAMGMGSYLGVAQGAMEPPKFIHMTLSPPGGKVSKRVCLVGKGLTFDSGGYNIKAGAGSMIEKMKFDMGGAGAVLGAARVLADAPPAGVEVHFIVAACENMVSESAMRPGDILTASNGKTIEVINTDAEGRLTLADALIYAETKTGGKVDAIVDVATLTGACIIALGPAYAGLWSDNDELSDRLLGSAKASGEPLWRMPLAQEYAEQIKSPISDLKNLGNGPQGGSITAALFLKEFVKETPWAHMDIAGPVWDDKQGGATGYGVRTLVDFVQSHAA